MVFFGRTRLWMPKAQSPTSIVPVHPNALDSAPTSIVPLNPVALDTTGQQLLEDALDLYTSKFSMSCGAYISGWKERSRRNDLPNIEGLGTRLCIEFQRRLHVIGVSVYCFAGGSESFWSKQASASEKYVDMYSLLCLKQGFKPLADDPPGTTKAVKNKGTSKRKRNEKGDPSCQPFLSFSQPPPDSPDTADGKNVEPIQTCGERSPVVLFMNMADEQRKRQLTKFVETLGRQVTDTGSKCTHVLTDCGKCLCHRAWILSPEWLGSSVEAKTFVFKIEFLSLWDFKANYNTDDASRTRAKPLFQGLEACLTSHIDQVVSRIEELTMPVSNSFVISCKPMPCKLETLQVSGFESSTWNG
ncbi:hypothetical protein SELMODRAFT_403850 [Selaginella moellendorffii]|uniref:BRCT domain-containing protein n=1 Tax=Selaginella moellendorffii TaxID=88036 RepID=D8QSR1_SELML|nr:hypothetical protein SELMODRAFT_403850 [Selaginella moellendorffii]